MVTVGHELFGHARSLALGRLDSQHVDAIQTENLILRVMKKNYINDGSRHADGSIIDNPWYENCNKDITVFYYNHSLLILTTKCV